MLGETDVFASSSLTYIRGSACAHSLVYDGALVCVPVLQGKQDLILVVFQMTKNFTFGHRRSSFDKTTFKWKQFMLSLRQFYVVLGVN